MKHDTYYAYIVERVKSICEFINSEDINKLINRLNNKYTVEKEQLDVSMLLDPVIKNESNLFNKFKVQAYFDLFCTKLERSLLLTSQQLLLLEEFYAPISNKLEEVVIN
jgi:hypothetical protein